MKQLFLTLALVVGLQINAQTVSTTTATPTVVVEEPIKQKWEYFGDWETYTDTEDRHYIGAYNSGFTVVGNKGYTPRFKFKFNNGYYFIYFNFFGKRDGGPNIPIKTEMIFNSYIGYTTTSSIDKDGDIMLRVPHEFIEELSKSNTMHVKFSSGNSEYVVYFDLYGTDKVIKKMNRVVSKFEKDKNTTVTLNTVDSNTTYTVNPYLSVSPELQTYLDSFIELAKLNGIDLSNVYDKPLYLHFVAQNELSGKTTLGTARGSRDDNMVWILISAEHWKTATYLERANTIYHELAHDILNASHVRNVDNLMNPSGSMHTIQDLFVALQRVFAQYKEGTLSQFNETTNY